MAIAVKNLYGQMKPQMRKILNSLLFKKLALTAALFHLISFKALADVSLISNNFSNTLLGPAIVKPYGTMPETSVHTASDYDTHDPFETINRFIFDINYWLDKIVLLNVAKVYISITPPPVHDAISNVLHTLVLPVTTLNHLFQGKGEEASESFAALILNLVFGLLGTVDVAGATGLAKTTNDFGKTLAFINVPSGPYIMLPLYGPTNPRDIFGTVVDWISSPFNIICKHYHSNAPYTVTGLNMVSKRADNIDFLNKVEKDAFDLYVTVRSLYMQSRSPELDNQEDTPRPFAWDGQDDIV